MQRAFRFYWNSRDHDCGIVELKDAFAAGAAAGPLPLIVGILSAAVVSWLAIDWLLKFLQRNSTWIFVAIDCSLVWCYWPGGSHPAQTEESARPRFVE